MPFHYMLRPELSVRDVIGINIGCYLTNENAEMSRPAKNGALDSEETSKSKTSFHAYGSMLVNAIGSATRTSAELPVSDCDAV